MLKQSVARRHTTRTAAAIPRGSTALAALACAVALLAGGCSQFRPNIPPSEGHISAPTPAAKRQAVSAIPPPARVSMLVPKPTPQVKPQTYNVVVHEVPVKELLLALARDTKQNIDVHPGLTGLVSLNAVNATLPAILERISKQINLRYRTEGNTIIVSPDMPYVKTYRVNYINMTRNTTSSIGASGEISQTSGASSGGSTSASNTTVNSTSNNDFWGQLHENIRSILNSTRLQSVNAEARRERLALLKQERELRVKQIEAAGRAGQGAPNPASAAISARGNSVQQASLVPDDVVVNPASGVITVNATGAQHQLIQSHIDNVVSSSQRQVLIEATIVEVALADAYQAGIDWSRLPISGGLAITQVLLGGFSGAAVAAGATAGNALTVGYTNPTTNVGNISGTVKLLQEFGNSRVLSSPKLMAMNNQTALLKVVDNVVYFEVQGSTTAGSVGVQPVSTFSSTAKTVAVGLVMGMTPQINEDGRVVLTVRPTISRLNPSQPFVNDPNPGLCDALRANCVANPVPQVQVREMESVLQMVSGQTVILGGLMQDNVRFTREQIPGADRLGAAGDLFRFRDESATKTELVIFLKPTIIPNPTLASDELKFFQRFLPQAKSTAKPAP